MKTKLRLTLDVTYDCEPCDVRHLTGNLEYLPRLAAGEGLLSDGCGAVVDVWSYKVKVREGK